MAEIERENKFFFSSQISLGELIQEIKKAGTTQEEGIDKTICFDFGYFYPNGLSSWRGSYSKLAIEYEYQSGVNVSAKDFLEKLESALGKTFEGHKGGEYVMTESTPVWVANYGQSGHTGVIGIHDNSYELIILTAYCEF